MERLSKNFIWMGAANIVSGLFSILVFIYLARTLMPEALGYFSYAFTFIFFLSNFVDLGLSTYGTRAIAKDRTKLSGYVSEIVSFRFIIAGFLGALFIIVTLLSHYAAILKIVMFESLLMLFVFAFATEWAFQGIEEMRMVFISFSATSILQFGLIYCFVRAPEDLFKAPICYFIATLPIIVIFLRRLKFKLKMRVEHLKKMMSHLSGSFVIWAISMFAQVYNSLDIFILGLFRKIEDVGYFTIARRFVGGMALLVVFLANAVLPRLSLTFSRDMAQFNYTTQRFLKLAVILTILIFLPIIFFSKEIISLTVGDGYLAASLPLKIMTIGLIFVLLNLPYSTGLIAGGLEKEVLKQAIASACLSVVSNFILIPKYGMVGSSVSFVLAEALALVWIIWVYEKRIKISTNC